MHVLIPAHDVPVFSESSPAMSVFADGFPGESGWFLASADEQSNCRQLAAVLFYGQKPLKAKMLVYGHDIHEAGTVEHVEIAPR